MADRSVEGTSSRQSFLPGSESAFSVRRSMILLYSKVVSTFVFMWGSLILLKIRSTSSKMLRISSLSGFRPIKIERCQFDCLQAELTDPILVLLNAGLHNNTISSCCALSKSLHPFAIRTIVLLAHVCLLPS